MPLFALFALFALWNGLDDLFNQTWQKTSAFPLINLGQTVVIFIIIYYNTIYYCLL